MRGAKAIFALIAVLEAQKLLAVMLPAACFFPQVGGLHHGHEQFTKIGLFHFFAHDAADFFDDPQAKGQVDIQPRCKPTNHARPQQELVADHFRIGRGFLECGNIAGAEAH